MLDNATPASRAAARAAYIANGRNWQRDWEVFLALDTYLQVGEGGTYVTGVLEWTGGRVVGICRWGRAVGITIDGATGVPLQPWALA